MKTLIPLKTIDALCAHYLISNGTVVNRETLKEQRLHFLSDEAKSFTKSEGLPDTQYWKERGKEFLNVSEFELDQAIALGGKCKNDGVFLFDLYQAAKQITPPVPPLSSKRTDKGDGELFLNRVIPGTEDEVYEKSDRMADHIIERARMSSLTHIRRQGMEDRSIPLSSSEDVNPIFNKSIIFSAAAVAYQKINNISIEDAVVIVNSQLDQPVAKQGVGNNDPLHITANEVRDFKKMGEGDAERLLRGLKCGVMLSESRSIHIDISRLANMALDTIADKVLSLDTPLASTKKVVEFPNQMT